jgi:hypothetical protein
MVNIRIIWKSQPRDTPRRIVHLHELPSLNFNPLLAFLQIGPGGTKELLSGRNVPRRPETGWFSNKKIEDESQYV